MKFLTAKVVDGRLDVPEGTLQEGNTVMLLVPDQGENGFHLSEGLQEELRAALDEADRGDSIDGWQLLSRRSR